MCHQVKCERCSKPTWSGCGSHVEQALADVAPGERCTCDQGDTGYFAASTGSPSLAISGAES
jgi:hypothetical protein